MVMASIVDRYFCLRCKIWHRANVTRDVLFMTHARYDRENYPEKKTETESFESSEQSEREVN